ncbi:hypothetical protein V5799_021947 [Amblyomma americanum]|uniref:Uncharacterized protein n=1 Tax=Amblyomma americanum TaxID=6943 RepID=A0AAQ4FME0_AMBAM
MAQELPGHKIVFALRISTDEKFSVLNHRCLTVSKIEPIKENRWQKKIRYHTFPRKTQTKIGWLNVGIKKTGQSCVYENVFTAFSLKEVKREWESRILYTDYRTCILMQSKVLALIVLLLSRRATPPTPTPKKRETQPNQLSLEKADALVLGDIVQVSRKKRLLLLWVAKKRH